MADWSQGSCGALQAPTHKQGPPTHKGPLGMLDASLERLPKVGSATMQNFPFQTARLRTHVNST